MKRILWIIGALIVLGITAVWVLSAVESNNTGEATISGSFTVPYTAWNVTIELRRESENGELVSEATVPISSSNSSTPAIFAINNVPPGTYSMIFRQPGHTRFVINGVVVGTGSNINISQNSSFPEQLPLLPGDVAGVGQVNITALSALLNNNHIRK